MALYLLAGFAGVPWFAEQQSGWEFGSFGYVVGFVAAACVVGLLAERRRGPQAAPRRRDDGAGQPLIYVFGVTG